MNNSELEDKLKAARGPALDKVYQETFAQSVLTKLRSAPQQRTPAKKHWQPRMVWGFATVICILIAFAAGNRREHAETKAVKDILANSKLVQETMIMFPNRVRAITQDERGMNLVLSEKEDVPTSTPIYIRICDGKRCSSLVTFSGQEIQIAGQRLTVLSSADGGIILEGNKFLWTNGEKAHAGKHLKIEARNLGPVAM